MLFRVNNYGAMRPFRRRDFPSTVAAPLQRPAGDAGFFYCDFWRSRRGHIRELPPAMIPFLDPSTDRHAMLSPCRIELDQPAKALMITSAQDARGPEEKNMSGPGEKPAVQISPRS